jgi:hypothetical protein
MSIRCPGTITSSHLVAPQPPADASVGEKGTCTDCGTRYLVVGIDPIRLAKAAVPRSRRRGRHR